MIVVPMTVSESEVSISMEVSDGSQSVEMDMEAEIVMSPKYRGSYEFTPTGERQIVKIEGKMAEENIVIDPIPNNYGLITWDGVTLTVS